MGFRRAQALVPYVWIGQDDGFTIDAIDPTAFRIYLTPFFNPTPVRITKASVGNGPTTSLCEVGAYGIDGAGNLALMGSTGAVLPANLDGVDIFTLANPFMLAPGRFYLAGQYTAAGLADCGHALRDNLHEIPLGVLKYVNRTALGLPGFISAADVLPFTTGLGFFVVSHALHTEHWA